MKLEELDFTDTMGIIWRGNNKTEVIFRSSYENAMIESTHEEFCAAQDKFKEVLESK